MWHSVLTTTTVSLLFSQVAAGIISGAAAQLVGRDIGLEKSVRRYVDPVERRQAAPQLNVTQWDADTMAACTKTLEGLKGVASNPSGMAVCYNLPSLNNITGVFQADLRLFKVSEPTGTFANISSQDVQVGLSYAGATVSAVNASSIGRRDDKLSLISWPRGIDKRLALEPVMAQAYAFVGQINADLLNIGKGTVDFRKVLVPTVTLTGTDSTSQIVHTTLSSQEATFVSGIFSTISTPTKSQVDIPIQTLVVASDKPFVIPGLNILIFPIGAIITGVWAVFLVITIAWGTYGRMQFRDNYRRRVAWVEKGDLARI